MKKSLIFAFLFAFLFFLSFNTVYAQRGSARADVIDMRLASPLPQNSDWGRALDRLPADWARLTNNQVRLRIIHNGTEGSETEVFRKLNSDAIQIAIFTSAGLADICPAVMNLSIPFTIKTEAEFDLVLDEILPVIETMVKNEFVVLAWSKGGWVYLFSKERVLTPEDLRRQRLATSPELGDMNTVFRTMGFQLIETDLGSLGTRLASNMINSVYVIPAFVPPMQLHRHLNHMLDFPIAPIMGAIVMNRITWNKLSADHQKEILNNTRRMAAEFDVSVPRTEASARAVMTRDGLNMNKPTRAQEDAWLMELERTMPSLVGNIFDRNIYNRINEILRKSRGE